MEVTTLSGIRDRLAEMAAADALHDFDGERGKKVANHIFSGMFAKHKGIGAPKEPSQLITEYDTLNMFLNFSTARGDSAIQDFKDKYYNDAYVTRDVPRATDDPIPYEVQSLKVGKHFSNKKDEWYITPSEFMDFLAPSGRDVAFCVDMDSTGLSHIFSEQESDVVKRTAYFVSPREFINDEAPKRDMTTVETETEAGNYSVQVRYLRDTYPQPIVYKSTDLAENPDPTFYSKFNVSITRAPDANGISLTDTIFTNDSGEIIKGNQVDKVMSENSVIELARNIYRFFTGNRTDYDNYYVMLQQKRSGDWLQVLSCLHTDRYPQLSGKNIPIIIITGDTICAAYAIAMGVDVIYTKLLKSGDKRILYCRKKLDNGVITEEERFAKIVAQLPKPDDKLPYLMNSSYLEVRDVFVQYRSELDERLFAELIPIAARLTAAADLREIEASLKLFLRKYSQIVLMRTYLDQFPVKKRGEETLNNLANVSIYESNLSILKRFFTGKEGDMPAAIKSELDKNTVIKRMSEFDTYVKDITITGRFFVTANGRVAAQSAGLLAKLKEYLTEEERVEFLRVVTIPSTKLGGDDLAKYRLFFDTTKLFVGMEGNGPKVHNWLLVTAIVEGVLEEPVAEAEAPVAAAEPEASGPAEAPEASGPAAAAEPSGPEPEPEAPEDEGEGRYELSSSYGPSVLLALRFQNKREKNHRIDDLDGRRHSAMTTSILFMYKLVLAMQDVEDRQSSDPEYSANNEYMLQYISQWISKIIRALPGTNTKKEYKDVECFLLGMIFQYESDMKESADYIEFLESFMRNTYGMTLTEYLIRECPHIAMEPFVFREGVPYSALIDDLKSLIRITLGKLRSYEEDPARIIELREKEARVAAAARAAEEADRAAAAAEAADTVARAAVIAKAEEEIASRAALKAAAEREAALAEEADRIHKMAEKARFDMGVAQRGVRKAVALASKRGPKNANRRYKSKFSMLRKSHKRGSEDFRGVTRSKARPA
jgi:hypothetical protein